MKFLNRLIMRMRFNRTFAHHPGLLHVTGEGLSFQRYSIIHGAIAPESVWKFAWAEVQRISAFKRDCFTVDQICLLFTLKGSAFEINEEMDGFNAVVSALPRHFPCMDAQWWKSVALPPFATNMMTIWPMEHVTQ